MAERRSSRQDTWSVVRLKPDLHAKLRAEARARDLSVTYLLNRAVEDLLERLVPVDEWKLTRDS